MKPEHETLCREVLKRVLFHTKTAETKINGWKSAFVLCFVEDEKKAMEEILDTKSNV